ncbi:hypothetical protein DB356_00340 [Pseudomonas congelans]|nr:hypothetical protein DB356_00340 [Pseudomonas congelans]
MPRCTLRSGRRASERRSHAEHGNDENLEMTIVPMLCVGTQVVTLRVTYPGRYARSG